MHAAISKIINNHTRLQAYLLWSPTPPHLPCISQLINTQTSKWYTTAMLGYYTIFFCTSIISHATLCTHNNWHKSTVKTKQYTKPRILCIVVCKSDLRCEVDIWFNLGTSQFQNTHSIIELMQWLKYSCDYFNYSRYNNFTSPYCRLGSTAGVPFHDRIKVCLDYMTLINHIQDHLPRTIRWSP